MLAVNGTEYVLKTRVVECHRMFRSGRQGTSSEAQPGQAHIVATPWTFVKWRKLFVYRRRDIYELEMQFDVSVGTLHTIVRRLGSGSMCAQ